MLMGIIGRVNDLSEAEVVDYWSNDDANALTTHVTENSKLKSQRSKPELKLQNYYRNEGYCIADNRPI